MLGRMERRRHWNDVYSAKPLVAMSWFEVEPLTSLRLIQDASPGAASAVLDIGAGGSTLVDELIDRGATDVSLLDVAETALDQVRTRLGARATEVTFINEDVLTWAPARPYDVWHDRAVFHFLTERDAQDRYIDTAARAVRDGGVLVIATFAEDGPTHCSGLPVRRYSAAELNERFSRSFSMVHEERQEHPTPGGAVQPFTWAVFRRQ